MGGSWGRNFAPRKGKGRGARAPLPHVPACGKTTHRPLKPHYARYLNSRLRSGSPAAHAHIRLVLLGSPPDTVHGWTLRRPDPSSLLIQVRRHSVTPGAGIHPCCSGLQVQGTAISPVSVALPQAGILRPRQADISIIHYFLKIIKQAPVFSPSPADFFLFRRHFFQKGVYTFPKSCYNIGAS